MRIVAIGNMKKEDITGMATTVGPMCHTPTELSPSYYGWGVYVDPG